MPLSVKNTVIFVGVIADIDMYMFVYAMVTRVTRVFMKVTRVTQELRELRKSIYEVDIFASIVRCR